MIRAVSCAPTASSCRGLTLLELLVALAVFAVMAALAYGGLNIVLESRSQAEAQVQRLSQLQKAFFRIARDLEQATTREIRDGFGDTQAAMTSVAGDEGEGLVEFTRGGWLNPAGYARSHLQRVAYTLADGDLVRQSWTVLDRAQDSESFEYVVLPDVTAVAIRFLDDGGEWQESWPKETTGAESEQPSPLPQAVEIRVELERWGTISRLFRMAA